MTLTLVGLAGAACAGGTSGSSSPPPPLQPTEDLGGHVRELPAGGTVEHVAGRTVATGRILWEDGTPAGGVDVGLSERDSGFGGFIAGLAGACDAAATSCGASGEASRTAADGTFRVVLDSVDDGYVLYASGPSRSGREGSSYAQAHFPAPPPGRRVPAGTAPATFPLPSLRLWDPAVTAVRSGGRVEIDYGKLPGEGVGELNHYSLFVGIVEREGGLWEEDVIGSRAVFDARLLEDKPTRGSIAVGTRATVGDQEVILRFSADFALPSGDERPLSRGLPCTTVGALGGTIQQDRCRLTDGDFVDTYSPWPGVACLSDQSPGCYPDVPDHLPITVDLGRVLPRATLVVRSCPFGCELAVSADGERWNAVEMEPAATGVTAVESAMRYVRVEYQQARKIRELSVFGPPE